MPGRWDDPELTGQIDPKPDLRRRATLGDGIWAISPCRGDRRGGEAARVSIPMQLWAAVDHVLQNSFVRPAYKVRRGA